MQLEITTPAAGQSRHRALELIDANAVGQPSHRTGLHVGARLLVDEATSPSFLGGQAHMDQGAARGDIPDALP
jgi:hypothetical protein